MHVIGFLRFFEMNILMNNIETVDWCSDKSKWLAKCQYNKRKTRRGVIIYIMVDTNQ